MPLRETDLVRRLGVKFRQGVEVGRDISFADLEPQFDAIFIGIGPGETWTLEIPGESLEGVYGAIEFIEKTKTLPFQDVEVGRRVACIGAGNIGATQLGATLHTRAAKCMLAYRQANSIADRPAR